MVSRSRVEQKNIQICAFTRLKEKISPEIKISFTIFESNDFNIYQTSFIL